MTTSPQKPAVPLLTGLIRSIRDCCQRQEGLLCRKLGLTPAQFACLVSMPAPAAALNVHQLAKVMGLSPSRTSRVIDSLVRGGIFSRHAMDSDRRTQLVALTKAGEEKWQEAQRLLAECEKKLLGHLLPQRTQELAETLRTLISAW